MDLSHEAFLLREARRRHGRVGRANPIPSLLRQRLLVFARSRRAQGKGLVATARELVTIELKKDLLQGDLFIFVGKDRKRATVLFWDGTGVCVYLKRLSQGRFTAPWQPPCDGSPLVLTHAELALFLEGCERVGKVRLSPPPFSFAKKSA